MRKELTSVITKCCADSYRKAKVLMTTALMTFSTLRIRSTVCRERFWATEPRRSCSSRNSTAYMLPREPRRREFSSLVATLLPRKTRGNLLQTKKLFQLAIAICVEKRVVKLTALFLRAKKGEGYSLLTNFSMPST